MAARPLLAALVLTACDAATVIEGRIDWRSDDGSYAVQYVAPPWEVDTEDGVELRLRVQPELFGTSVQGSPPTHVFVLGPVDPAVPIEALLLGDLAIDPAAIADALDDAGGTSTGDLPLPLDGVDLDEPRAVALAELNQLVDADEAELRRELAQPEPGGPWRYEVVVAPGMHVLALYYRGKAGTIRALFGSLFDIGDGDIEHMAETIQVDGSDDAVTLALACLLLFGPPKLPPLGGRNLPAPEVEAAAPVEAKAEPAPPPPPPPSTPTARAPSPRPGPPTSIAGAVFPETRPPPAPPAPPVRTGAATRPAGAAAPLRQVSKDEVAGWDAEDRRASALAPKGSATSETKREDVALRRTATPDQPEERLTFRRAPRPPQRSAAFVLGYRFFRVQDPLGRAQDWHIASLEVSPLRRYVRVNLITEFGVEGGPAARAGDRADILLMERLGIGAQYPGVVTPFIEFQGGVGAARLELFGRNDLALLYGLGLDAGAQWAVTRWMYLHAAIGWIRPTFVLPDRSSSFDRVAFKLGIGF